MKKLITGFLIGSLIFGGIVFARDYIVDFSEESIPTLNEIIRQIWYAIDDLKVRKFALQTIADGDVTPDVSKGNFFITSSNTGATAITDLDNPRTGQVICIIGGSAANSSTIADGGAKFKLSANWTASVDEVLWLYVKEDDYYIELTRSAN